MRSLTIALNIVLNELQLVGICANTLVSRSDIRYATKNELQTISGSINCVGITSYSTSKKEILISSELLYPHVEAVLAHEIFHVYSFYNNLNLSHIEEEGCAELLSHFIYHRLSGLASHLHKTAISHNPDKVYGDGFRIVYKKAVEHGGIKNYLHAILLASKSRSI